jgi:hypothetical protein
MELTNIHLATVGGIIKTQHGPAIAIYHQYAYVGYGKTIHSAVQLEMRMMRTPGQSRFVVDCSASRHCVVITSQLMLPVV